MEQLTYTLVGDMVTVDMLGYKELRSGRGVIVHRDTESSFGWLFMLVDNTFLFVSRENNEHTYIASCKVIVRTETKASDLLLEK